MAIAVFVGGASTLGMAQATPSTPPLLMMCEDTDGCSRWQFAGGKATGSWSSGAIGSLTVERFDSADKGTVSIRRVDSAGAAAGLTATYTGTRNGPIVEGRVHWKSPGHPDGETHWRGIILRDTVNLLSVAARLSRPVPPTINVCENGRCYSWSFQGNSGLINSGNQVIANLKVERFDDNYLIIRRNEINGSLKGLEAVYVGVINGSSIEGLASWKWPGQPSEGGSTWRGSLPGPAATPRPQPPTEVVQLPPLVPIEKLIDVLLPDPAPKMQPPPAVQWKPKQTLAAFDLNGTWQREGTPEKVLAFQMRDRVFLAHLEGMRHYPDHMPVSNFLFSTPTAATGIFRDATPQRRETGENMNVTLTDANHFQVKVNFGTPSSPAMESWTYVRVSSTAVQDVPCDAANSHHLSGDEAEQRGDLYLEEKDFPAANCWFYVAALGGNGEGLAEYGKSIYTGRGIAQNQAAGIARIQEAAVQGSARACGFLTELFKAGAGIPRSKQRSDYWLARYYGTSPELPHEQQPYMRWDWMNHGSPPCSANNPDHTDANSAYLRGRVAYEARLFPRAHCWMRISAEQGNVKAWTYLGLMSAYGMGVEPNLKNGFNYMYHAAHEHDPYAMVYLANFWRYGIGIPANDIQGRSVMQEAMNMRGGMDAFADVEGDSVSYSQAMSMIGSVVTAAAADEMECNRQPVHHTENRGGKPVDVITPAPPCKSPAADAIMSRVDADGKTTLAAPEELFPEKRLPIF